MYKQTLHVLTLSSMKQTLQPFYPAIKYFRLTTDPKLCPDTTSVAESSQVIQSYSILRSRTRLEAEMILSHIALLVLNPKFLTTSIQSQKQPREQTTKRRK